VPGWGTRRGSYGIRLAIHDALEEGDMTRESFARLAGAAILMLGMGSMGCQTTQDAEQTTQPEGSEWREAPSEDSMRESHPLTDLQTIYFDFDRSDIRPDARDALRANADEIKKTTGIVTIEGHTDERGSSEYNLALGERRANAAKRYLVDLGVGSSQLNTVSFGEDRPAVQGHDESAWRYNRRAEFVGN
jgi:peptidoglycan-associated lipoprotein